MNGGMCTIHLIGTLLIKIFLKSEDCVDSGMGAEQSCRGFQFPQIQMIQH